MPNSGSSPWAEKFPAPWCYHPALGFPTPMGTFVGVTVFTQSVLIPRSLLASGQWSPVSVQDLLTSLHFAHVSLVPFVDSGKPLWFFIAILNFNPGPQYARNPPGLVWWADFISILYSIIRVTNENIKQKQALDRPWVTPLKMNFQFDGKPW